MSALTADGDHTIEVPETLTAAESKLVYVSLVAAGGATVEELHRALGVRKLTLFPVLATLADRNVIDREGPRYVPTGQ